MTEDEVVGCHHQLDGHEFEQAPGAGDGQGTLACCCPWGRKESDMTKQLTLHYYTIHTQMYIFTYLISHVQPYGEALWRVR